MTKYKNLSGGSGVDKYLITDTSIKIQFVKSNKVYVYNHIKPGSSHVIKMKELAEAGRGLATYISQIIKKNYHSIES
ncbi:MAG: hypothetical protein Q7J27_10900 [Syntrophales bacterium]|nr:hypothetical protein [Syntrophales bacterium]